MNQLGGKVSNNSERIARNNGWPSEKDKPVVAYMGAESRKWNMAERNVPSRMDGERQFGNGMKKTRILIDGAKKLGKQLSCHLHCNRRQI